MQYELSMNEPKYITPDYESYQQHWWQTDMNRKVKKNRTKEKINRKVKEPVKVSNLKLDCVMMPSLLNGVAFGEPNPASRMGMTTAAKARIQARQMVCKRDEMSNRKLKFKSGGVCVCIHSL